MTKPDHGHPESEEDLEHIRERNSQRRSVNPEEPGTIGDAHRGVLSNRVDDDNTKARSGSDSSPPPKR